VATAWALGISPELMAAGIETFPVAVALDVSQSLAAVTTAGDTAPHAVHAT
jgi:hypothetical protein